MSGSQQGVERREAGDDEQYRCRRAVVRAIAELIKPGAVFAEDADAFGPALDALPGVAAIVSKGDREGTTPFPVF